MKLKKLYRKHFNKVPFFDPILWSNYLKTLGIVSSLVSVISFFATADDIAVDIRYLVIAFLIAIVVIFLYMWWQANHIRQVELWINQTNISVEVGNIFESEEGCSINIIAVNDFFDTVADDRIVAKKTLHGQFIERIIKQGKLVDLRNTIDTDDFLNADGNWEVVQRGDESKEARRYKTGSVVEFDSFVLTAFTKFDENNRAFLSAEEYTGFWMRFWENIDVIYAGRTLNLPLIGAGITRFRNGKPSKQELLESMLWTLKISGFRNTYADSKIRIIIFEKDASEIDFYHIQHNRSFR